jgi:hypothetical protein
MSELFAILRCTWALLAAALLGRWFLRDLTMARARRAPWYRAYLTLPGFLILLAVFLPVAIWFLRRY